MPKTSLINSKFQWEVPLVLKVPEFPYNTVYGMWKEAPRPKKPGLFNRVDSWWRSTVVERRSLTGELSLSCARPAADG